ncbi:MAG: hypothetical protein CBD88_07930 [Flavobacteriales bacterium TMED228]|nr:MAG: hypothetical protein CBD88_07930 [Flavobacteriales bacterium TMED228]
MKGILKALAPKLVDVVASSNPVASTVLKMATKKLGMPENSTPEQIEEEIERNPEKATMISDVERQVSAMNIELESFKTEVEDRKHARETFKNDWTPKVFCILSLILYGSYVMIVTLVPFEQNETIQSLVLGQLSGILGTCAAFFYSSNGKG